jgi:hypothetical protein
MKPHVPEMTAEQLKNIPLDKLQYSMQLCRELLDEQTELKRLKEILLELLFEDLIFDYADRYTMSALFKATLKRYHWRFMGDIKDTPEDLPGAGLYIRHFYADIWTRMIQSAIQGVVQKQREDRERELQAQEKLAIDHIMARWKY